MRGRAELAAERATSSSLRAALRAEERRREEAERAVQVMLADKTLVLEQAEELRRQRRKGGQRAAVGVLRRLAAELQRAVTRAVLRAWPPGRHAPPA
eukprot:2242992-Rhodomonas_salina.1